MENVLLEVHRFLYTFVMHDINSKHKCNKHSCWQLAKLHHKYDVH